jgi:hypothetical protein
LLVDGSITSATTVNDGAALGGSGTVGAVTVMSGGTIAPGNSAGLLSTTDASLRGGANYVLDLGNDGVGAAGSEWDSLAVAGTLDISTLTAANPLNIRLRSLSGGQPGEIDWWNPGVDHTWSNVITTAGLNGVFDNRLFRLDATNFAGRIHGTFSIAQNDANFDLVYNAAEIPSGVLVSNLEEPLRFATPVGNNPNPADPPEGPGAPWYWGAQRFTNDGLPHMLASITAKVGGASTEPAPVVVAELHADSGGAIGELLTTLTAPDLSGAIGDHEFLPTSEVMLHPGASYWVVLGAETPGDGTYFWQYANSNFAAGTGVLDNYADSTESGASWIYRSTDFPYFLQGNVVEAAPPVADFNGDGAIDGEDLVAWQDGFGVIDGLENPAEPTDGDADGDLDVDGADFLAWQRQLDVGAVLPMSAVIPEPASFCLVATWACSLPWLSRGRR